MTAVCLPRCRQPTCIAPCNGIPHNHPTGSSRCTRAEASICKWSATGRGLKRSRPTDSWLSAGGMAAGGEHERRNRRAEHFTTANRPETSPIRWHSATWSPSPTTSRRSTPPLSATLMGSASYSAKPSGTHPSLVAQQREPATVLQIRWQIGEGICMGVVRWGVAGTGAITEQVTADFAHVEDARNVAVSSRDLARATSSGIGSMLQGGSGRSTRCWPPTRTLSISGLRM